MERILTDIISHLETNRSAIGLSYIDEDYGQMESGTDTYPVTYPAVLIELQNIDWEGTGGREQRGEATIVVRTYIDCYDDTHALSTTIDKVKERTKIASDVTSLLHECRLSGGATLTRTASAFATIGNGIKQYETTYRSIVWQRFRREEERQKINAYKIEMNRE